MNPGPRPAVIVCTHNPRADYLGRTLGALRAQTLPPSDYDLLVVDNASAPPLEPRIDLAWHPGARVVAESALGLTNARLRGIEEARSDFIVWVDDDNLLAPDYLAQAQALAREWPMLGAWGCGDFTPEWETPPLPAFSPYLEYLAVGKISADRWSNHSFDYATLPAGAGMCCRIAVARRYAEAVRTDPRRRLLGRTGAGLGACEDFDLALHAVDLGLGTGIFPRLRLTHLMPAGRVREEYLLRLVEGHARSTVLLMALRRTDVRPPSDGWIARLRRWRLRRALSPIDRRIHDARRRGEAAATKILAETPPLPDVP